MSKRRQRDLVKGLFVRGFEFAEPDVNGAHDNKKTDAANKGAQNNITCLHDFRYSVCPDTFLSPQM